MSKPRIADLQRDADRAFNVGDPNVFWPEPVGSALLRLARAAKDFRRLPTASSADEIDDAINAFDWGEE